MTESAEPGGVVAAASPKRLGFLVHQPLSSLFAGNLNSCFGGFHAVALEDGSWQGAPGPRSDRAVAAAPPPRAGEGVLGEGGGG